MEPASKDLQIPPANLKAWQETVDIMAELIGIPAGLIMRLNEPDIEVFVSSQTEGNPYHPGDKEEFWGSGLYCETVIKEQKKLLVPNALSDDNLSSFGTSGFYKDYHQGVSFLFETTLVYLIFRDLIANNYPILENCEVRWEDPYPNNAFKKVNLLLRPSSPLPEAFIESKIWKKEFGEDLKSDIDKMKELPTEIRRFILVIWWDPTDGETNLKWLEGELPVKKIRHNLFPTKMRNRNKRIETINAILALIELR